MAKEKEKFYYFVSCSAEDESTGYVLLTKEEAEGVAKATNKTNWLHSDLVPYSGFFHINASRPMTEKEMEEDIRWRNERENGWDDEDDDEEYYKELKVKDWSESMNDQDAYETTNGNNIKIIPII